MTAVLVFLGVLLYGAGCGVGWVLCPGHERADGPEMFTAAFWPICVPAILAARATRAWLLQREREARLEEERAAFVERQYRELMTEQFGEAQVEKRKT